MAIKFLNFDYDASNPTAYQYTAADFRTVYNQLSSNGIVLSPTANIATDNSLKVTAITGGVRISSGVAAIQGAFAIVTNEGILFSTDGTYKVVLEFNSVLNKIYAKISTDALTRTSTVWQLQLATVVKSGSTYTVTDTRTDANLCGYANRLFDASATKIQNVPVATTAPTAGQILAFNAVNGQYEPTTIIETGSNANGAYIKFSDGTMICRIRRTVTDQAINTAYGNNFLGYRTWTFPMPFVSLNDIAITIGEAKWGTGAGWTGGASAVTTTNCQLNFFDALSRAAGTGFTFSALAIGYWK